MLNKSKSYWLQADIDIVYKYIAFIPYHIDWNEACIWLIEQIGLPGQQYYVHHGITQMTVGFKQEEDYIWFVLRWS